MKLEIYYYCTFLSAWLYLLINKTFVERQKKYINAYKCRFSKYDMISKYELWFNDDAHAVIVKNSQYNSIKSKSGHRTIGFIKQKSKTSNGSETSTK